MGLSLDEWGITLVGVVPAIILLNSGNAKLGLACMRWYCFMLCI